MLSDRDRPPYGPGQVLGSKYRLLKVLGEGGMSVVYDAVDTTCERSVAVKVIRPSLASRRAYSQEQIRREAEVLVRLRQKTEFVVDVLTAGITGDEAALPFYVMERLRGDTLREHLAEQIMRRVEFTIDELTTTTMSIAIALAHAHALGVVHRDIKPENVFMALMLDGDVKAKVLDFGICDDGTEPMAASHGFTGTLAYAAPEQLEGGRPTPAADIYALGLVILELAIQKLPHGRHKGGLTPERLAAAILKNPLPDVASLRLDLPPRLSRLIGECLAPREADRPSALDVARILRDVKHEFLGELSGHGSSQATATDVSGPPVSVLQEQLARATSAGAPTHVEVVRGEHSVELGAATDDASQEEDIVFSRRPSTLAAIERSVATDASRASSKSQAAVLPGDTLEALPTDTERVPTTLANPLFATGGLPSGDARVRAMRAAQDVADREAARRFAQSFLESHPGLASWQHASVVVVNASDGPVSSDSGVQAPSRSRAKAKVRTTTLAVAAPVMLLLAALATGRVRGSARGDRAVSLGTQATASASFATAAAPPPVAVAPPLSTPDPLASNPVPAAAASSSAEVREHLAGVASAGVLPVAPTPTRPRAAPHPSGSGAPRSAALDGPHPNLGEFRTTLGTDDVTQAPVPPLSDVARER